MDNIRERFVSVFADQDVGIEVIRFLAEKYPWHIKNVITTQGSNITSLAKSFKYDTLVSEEIVEWNAKYIFNGVDIIFLAWWPNIVPKFIIEAPRIGVVNFHPSLLPFNRGKHYNFWTLVEDTPFGVTLHFADDGIDSGDIIFQEIIPKDWEDTGETLYIKAKDTIISLFKKRYLDIIEGRYTRRKQHTQLGSLHYSNQMDIRSRLYLDKSYNLRDLLNLLRARTFKGNPACSFIDEDRKFEVRISISEVTDEQK